LVGYRIAEKVTQTKTPPFAKAGFWDISEFG